MFFIFTIYTLWLLYKWHSLTFEQAEVIAKVALEKRSQTSSEIQV